MNIKTTMRLHSMPIRMAKIKNRNSNVSDEHRNRVTYAVLAGTLNVESQKPRLKKILCDFPLHTNPKGKMLPNSNT